jgi:glycosyltransferase involved in cell wall biosynthesis
LQEALITGVPCVVARSPGYDHYLRDDEALFVERDSRALRDALKRLAGDKELRDGLAARARAAGRREFGVAPFTAAYEQIYLEAISAVSTAQPTPVRP